MFSRLFNFSFSFSLSWLKLFTRFGKSFTDGAGRPTSEFSENKLFVQKEENMPRFARLQPSPTLLSLPLQPSLRPPHGRGSSKSPHRGKLLRSKRGASSISRWMQMGKEHLLQRASPAKSIFCCEPWKTPTTPNTFLHFVSPRA